MGIQAAREKLAADAEAQKKKEADDAAAVEAELARKMGLAPEVNSAFSLGGSQVHRPDFIVICP